MAVEWGDDHLLTPREVAEMFRVGPKTVTRWARAGELEAVRTPGQHRRYLRSTVLRLMGSRGPESGAGPGNTVQD